MENQLQLFDSPRPKLERIDLPFEGLVELVKSYGYNVAIMKSPARNVITWATNTHWASATFVDGSDADMEKVCQRLRETVYSIRFRELISQDQQR